MSDREQGEARLEALEVRVAYQDQTIEDLNTVVAAQWKEIERLARELERVADRLQRAEEAAGSDEPEPPPPHY
jgi:SlyX protein